MSWWGKVLGGTFGMFLGGPIGAVLGAALGHNFDRGVERLSREGPGNDGFTAFRGGDVERIQSLFFTTTFSLMGHMAKADGRVSNVEIRAAEDVMRQMNLNEQQRKVAIRLFQEGKKTGFPLEAVLEQFRAECQRRRNLTQMLLEILTFTALSDGHFHDSERKILLHVAGRLGYSQAEYEAILQRLQASQHFHQARPDSRTALKDAFAVLGVQENTPEAEIKKAYRRLMNQHHPDKLVAKGLPQEMIDVANRKTQEIRDAWETIKKHRSL